MATGRRRRLRARPISDTAGCDRRNATTRRRGYDRPGFRPCGSGRNGRDRGRADRPRRVDLDQHRTDRYDRTLGYGNEPDGPGSGGGQLNLCLVGEDLEGGIALELRQVRLQE